MFDIISLPEAQFGGSSLLMAQEPVRSHHEESLRWWRQQVGSVLSAWPSPPGQSRVYLCGEHAVKLLSEPGKGAGKFQTDIFVG